MKVCVLYPAWYVNLSTSNEDAIYVSYQKLKVTVRDSAKKAGGLVG